SAGLAGNATSFTWDGILVGLPTFWRVNALTSSGWVTSATGAFMPCAYPAVLGNPFNCDSNTSATVNFNWAPMGYSVSVQYLDLSSDPNFSPGSFVTVGPLTPATRSYSWSSIPANVAYYYRINELAGDGYWYST